MPSAVRLLVLAALVLQTATTPPPPPAPTTGRPYTWLPVTPDDRLPRVVYPEGWTGGADIAFLERITAHVRAGIQPLDEPPPTQTPVVTIQPGDALRFEWNYTFNPVRLVKFRLWLDTEIYKNFVTADLTATSPTGTFLPGTVVTVTTNPGAIPPFTDKHLGTHTLSLTAYDAASEGLGPFNESLREEMAIPIEVAFTTRPPAPFSGKVFIVKLAMGDDGMLRVVSITEEK
jgi:hypothetical protein